MQLFRLRILRWLAGPGIVVAIGCSGDEAPPRAAPVKTPAATAQDTQPPRTSGSTTDNETTAGGAGTDSSAEESAAGYGSVTGQFKLSGGIPDPEVIVVEGDPAAKDSEVCAARTIYSEKLIVDPDTKGIRHIFVYLRKSSGIHPDLASSDKSTVIFDQKGCRFEPHTLLVRTDQSVVIKSGDPINHNTHTNPVFGQSANFLMLPSDRKGVELRGFRAERQPFKVNCDVHPWMLAWWLVLDHPYAAITDEQGRFKIDKLPAGDHEFRVWHEGRYIDREFRILVTAGATTTLDPVELSLTALRR